MKAQDLRFLGRIAHKLAFSCKSFNAKVSFFNVKLGMERGFWVKKGKQIEGWEIN